MNENVGVLVEVRGVRCLRGCCLLGRPSPAENVMSQAWELD
jgi:hypothetical protein